MTDALKVTLVQSRLHWRDPELNRHHLESLIASAGSSNLFILPETFTTGFLGESTDTEEGMEGATTAWLTSLAGQTGAAITGSAVITDGGGRRNRMLFVEPGGVIQYYDKRHLFAFAGEDQHYVAGSERVVFDYRGWRLCPQICYDLRFPVWCRSRGDYDLLLMVANWPARRVDAWDSLLKARAIENQCYVVAVNRVGEDGNGVQYPGHSAVYGPLGETVIASEDAECTPSATLRLDTVREVRASLPFSAEADEFSIEV